MGITLERLLWEAYSDALDAPNPTAALEAARLAVRLCPENATWVYRYGEKLRAVGHSRTAEQILLAAYPRMTELREWAEISLARVCEALGRWDEAEAWFRKATESAPGKTGPWIVLAGFLAGDERFEEACGVLERGLMAEGDRDEVYLNLAMNRRALDDLEGAKACCEDALALTPDYAEAKRLAADLDEALRIRNELRPLVERAVAGRASQADAEDRGPLPPGGPP